MVDLLVVDDGGSVVVERDVSEAIVHWSVRKQACD